MISGSVPNIFYSKLTDDFLPKVPKISRLFMNNEALTLNHSGLVNLSVDRVFFNA